MNSYNRNAANSTSISPIVRVFVSSTWLDLQSERKAVEAALQRILETKFVGMEYFGSRSEHTRVTSLRELEHSQVYVGIFAGRYGSGTTEDEYRRARKLKRPCLIYFKDEKAIPEGEPYTDTTNRRRLIALKKELQGQHTIATFTTPEDLAAKATSDLYRLLNEYRMTWETLYKAFAESSTSLSRYIRAQEFQSLITERTKNFVGRDFVFKAIDGFIKDPHLPCGYIVIIGEPGIGKTAIMAQLVKRYGWVHHFNIVSQNIRSAKAFLENICAQLIVRYKLEHLSLPPEATQDSGFLSQLLLEAAGKHKGQPLVILVDALDEAENLTNANRLYLPENLPEGVFFIVTMREKYRRGLRVDRCKDIFLRDDDPQNKQDIREYIQNFLQQHSSEMALRLQEWRVEKSKFIAELTEKSEGNFMYVVYVLDEIREGSFNSESFENIHDLPRGLTEYYECHWNLMYERDRERFEKYYRPIACYLAAAVEPVSIEQIMEWARLDRFWVQEAIDKWREFFNWTLKDGKKLYKIYHNSFQNFLREEKGLKDYHNSIAQTAHDKILWDETNDNQLKHLNPYELSHLPAHYEEAEREKDLYRLFKLEYTNPSSEQANEDPKLRHVSKWRGWFRKLLNH